MSATRMTPGPWHFDGRRWIRDASGLGVLRLQPNANPADACLAAAAPTMLAALRLAERFMAGFEDDDLQDGINQRLATIREAIAMAKGEKT